MAQKHCPGAHSWSLIGGWVQKSGSIVSPPNLRASFALKRTLPCNSHRKFSREPSKKAAALLSQAAVLKGPKRGRLLAHARGIDPRGSRTDHPPEGPQSPPPLQRQGAAPTMGCGHSMGSCWDTWTPIPSRPRGSGTGATCSLRMWSLPSSLCTHGLRRGRCRGRCSPTLRRSKRWSIGSSSWWHSPPHTPKPHQHLSNRGLLLLVPTD
mmetsp:Transcript_89015/g.154390  ORF Transcript_89015/g.154390 Transcript_89015/m.154390 type:complete len:209 (+) Transcript_89015:715-1341(+)